MPSHSGESKPTSVDSQPLTSHPSRLNLAGSTDSDRDLVERSRDLLCVHDLEGRLLSVNPVPGRLLSYTTEEILQTPLRDLIDPKFRDRFDVYLREVERMGQAHGVMAVIPRSGDRQFWEYHGTLLTGGVETPVVRVIAHDVTDRILAEKALRQANEKLMQRAHEQEAALRELRLFRSLLDQSNDAIEVVDPETLRFLDVNETECAQLGYSRKELLSMTIFDVNPNITRDSVARVREQLLKNGFVILEGVHRRKDGTLFPVEVNLKRAQLHRNYIVAVARDITKRKLRTDRLQEYERVVENLDEMIVVVDRERRYVLANRAFLRPRGMTKEQVVGRHLSEILGPNSYETMIKEKLDEAFRGNVVDYEMKYQYPEIGERDLAITYLPIEGPSGIDRVASVLQDITERKRAAALLEESEKRFRAVHDRAPAGISLVDARSGRFLQVNPKLCEIAGRTEEEMLRLGYLDITHPEDRPAAAERTRQLIEEKVRAYDAEKRYLRPDGTVVWVNLSVTPMWVPEKEAQWFMTIVQDISDRRMAEDALRESEGRFRLFIEHAPAALAMFDREMRYLHVSRRWQTDYGFGDRDLRGLSHYEVFPEVPDRWREAHRRGLAGEVVREESDRFERADGSVQWVRWEIRPWYDKTGGIGGIVIFAEDITERLIAEEALRASEERMRLAQQAAGIGVFERNLQAGGSSWSPEMEAIFGLPPGMAPETADAFMQLVHPGDRERMGQVMNESFATGTGATEWRVIWPDGSLHWVSSRWRMFNDEQGRPLRALGVDIDITERKRMEEELRKAKERLTEEKLYLEQEIDTEFGFHDIIGQSPALKAVMESVAKVANSDATVLLLGETGTGKELVARAIHRLSQRSGNAFIKMNCAAIPSGLLESELFGNEKGAFTGAVSKKIGRLELADKGTLFLDEIGEIALELQPKLLRVLQDHEFERLGGTQTLRSDFRLIAATNRDLAESVQENEFRSDLYYRLNVFPIHLPPLRDRRDDIPLLVEHFVQKCARRMNKSITSIPTKTMTALIGWDWPGNIRELENFVERSVILTNGSVLAAPLGELRPTATERSGNEDETLKAKEREHILQALRQSHGQISGLRGAAARLGLKRTTLQSKLKLLGINPRVLPPLS